MTSIRDEAREEAEREMAEAREQVGITVQEQRRYIEGFTAGAVWASDQADREPSDAEVEAAAEVFWEYDMVDDYRRERARAALLAAQGVRNG